MTVNPVGKDGREAGNDDFRHSRLDRLSVRGLDSKSSTLTLAG